MQNKITYEQIIEDLKNAPYYFNIQDEKIIVTFFNCLSNEKYTTVGPLSEIETNVLREYYGINPERTRKYHKKIMEDLKLSEKDLDNIFDNIREKTTRINYDINKLNLSDSAREFCFANNIGLTINLSKINVDIPKNVDVANNLIIINEIKNAISKYSQLSTQEKIFRDIIYSRDMWWIKEDKRILIANCLLNETYKKVNDLSLYDTQLLRERFGINLEGKSKNYTELGKIFEVSATTIKEHVRKAIRNLRYLEKFQFPPELHLSGRAAEFYFANNITLKWGQMGYDIVIPQYVDVDNNIDIINEIQQAVLEYSRKVAFDRIKELEKKLDQQKDNKENNDIPIEELDLSVRAYNCLRRSVIHTVNDLQKIDIDGLFRIRNLGRKAMHEIVEKIHSLGLRMHETVEEYFQEIINASKSQSDTDQSVEVIDFEEQTEHTIKENDETKKRIDEKEKLLLRYKEVSQEKESLLKKEAALDAELQEIMQKIQKSNMEKKDEPTKR